MRVRANPTGWACVCLSFRLLGLQLARYHLRIRSWFAAMKIAKPLQQNHFSKITSAKSLQRGTRMIRVKNKSMIAIGLFVAATMLAISPAFSQTRIEGDKATAVPVPTTSQPQAAQMRQVPTASATASNDPRNRGTIILLKAILETEALQGRFPSNTPLLAEIQRLVQGNGVQRQSTVKVTNQGPGQLRTINQDGTGWLLTPGQSVEVQVGSTLVNLESDFQNALVEFRHVRDAPARFWDQDDQRHYSIGPGTNHQATLTPGVRGYHLEQ